MSDLLIPKIILPSDMSATISMKEVAKILTATEGKTSQKENDEIFSIFMGMAKVRQDMKDFFSKTTDPVGEIFDCMVEHEGITNVLDAQRKPIRWIFSVMCTRIPMDVYKTTTPEQALRQAGEGIGMKLCQKYGVKVHFMYGDSRVYGGPSNTGRSNVNLGFVFGYKEDTGQFS